MKFFDKPQKKFAEEREKGSSHARNACYLLSILTRTFCVGYLV